MSGKNARQVVLTPDPRSPIPDVWPDVADLPDDMQAIQDFVAEQGGVADAKIHAYRMLENGDEAFLKKYTPLDFDWEDIARNFGSGHYRIRGYRYNPNTGKRVVFINRKQLIETPNGKPTAPEIFTRREPESEMMLLMKSMNDSFVKLGELIVQARPQPQDEMQYLDKMLRYKELFSGTPAPAHDTPLPMEQTLGVFKEMLSFVKENAGGGDNEPVGDGKILLTAIEKFAPLLVDVIQKAQHQPAALPAPTNAAVAAPQRAPVNPPGLTAQPAIPPHIEAEIRKNVITLVEAAMRDADPSPYAALAIEQTPPDQADALLNDPQWLNKLAVYDVRVLNFKEWFEEFREAALEMLTESPASPDTDENPSGGVNVLKPAGQPN